jgi:U3 small nucleolar RNA-associated protein 20
MLPTLAPTLVNIIEGLLKTDHPRGEFATSSENSTWALGSSLRALTARKATTWKMLVDVKAWSRSILEKWSWSEMVMAAFVQVVKEA